MPGPYPYSEKTDVYSFSLMLWEVITLKPLFVRPREYEGKVFTLHGKHFFGPLSNVVRRRGWRNLYWMDTDRS